MQIVQFWLNNKDYNEAVRKLGDKSELYGFAKECFLSKLEGVKAVKKEVWYVCPEEGKEFRQIVRAEIEARTGRLIPICDCGRGLVRRVKRIAEHD